MCDFREGRSTFVHVFDGLLESREHREMRRAVEQAVREQHAALRDDCERARACPDAAHAAGEELRDRLREKGRDVPPTAFTPKQIIQVELYAARHYDAGERARLKGLIQAAEQGHVLAGGRGKRESQAEGLGGRARVQTQVTLERDAARPAAAPDRVHDHDEHAPLH
ncbi:MAG: hypothetical protein LC802_09230 [Acidobacteria bacterium]|nr:hypothetical protein [Acidobacteriota bacterium]